MESEVSKPRKRWWGYVRRVIRDYPILRVKLDDLKRDATSVTPAYGPVSGHSAPSRPVEAVAMITLPGSEQRELEAVEAAIRETKQLPDGELRLRIIDKVFFRHSHTLAGAAMAEHMSYPTAKRKQNQFIRLVGEKMGLT